MVGKPGTLVGDLRRIRVDLCKTITHRAGKYDLFFFNKWGYNHFILHQVLELVCLVSCVIKSNY